MTTHDELLVAKARHQYWMDINEDLAETEEGRQALHDLAVHGYHMEEAEYGLI